MRRRNAYASSSTKHHFPASFLSTSLRHHLPYAIYLFFVSENLGSTSRLFVHPPSFSNLFASSLIFFRASGSGLSSRSGAIAFVIIVSLYFSTNFCCFPALATLACFQGLTSVGALGHTKGCASCTVIVLIGGGRYRRPLFPRFLGGRCRSCERTATTGVRYACNR